MTTRPQDLTCDRCGIGFVLSNAALAKRTERGNTDSLCPDCETIDKPIIGYYDNCRAWQGECDEFDRPIRNGKLWKPGVRICGRADCVRIAHIQADFNPFPEGEELPQIEVVSVFEPVKEPEPLVIPKADKKPSKRGRPKKPEMPEPMPDDFFRSLEAERHDLTYRGHPKLTLNQLKVAVELERYK